MDADNELGMGWVKCPITVCTDGDALVHDERQHGHYDAQERQEDPVLAQSGYRVLPDP